MYLNPTVPSMRKARTCSGRGMSSGSVCVGRRRHGHYRERAAHRNEGLRDIEVALELRKSPPGKRLPDYAGNGLAGNGEAVVVNQRAAIRAAVLRVEKRPERPETLRRQRFDVELVNVEMRA